MGVARREAGSVLTTVGQALAENVFAASAYGEAIELALRELELNEQELLLRQRELELCQRGQNRVERLMETLERLAKTVPAEARDAAAGPVPVRPPAPATRPAVVLAALRVVDVAAEEHRRERQRSAEERAALRAEVERLAAERSRTHEIREQLVRALAAVDPAFRAAREAAPRDPAEL
jgi:DNA repair exonuclease SbcCD ATPase subunit